MQWQLCARKCGQRRVQLGKFSGAAPPPLPATSSRQQPRRPLQRSRTLVQQQQPRLQNPHRNNRPHLLRPSRSSSQPGASQSLSSSSRSSSSSSKCSSMGRTRSRLPRPSPSPRPSSPTSSRPREDGRGRRQRHAWQLRSNLAAARPRCCLLLPAGSVSLNQLTSVQRPCPPRRHLRCHPLARPQAAQAAQRAVWPAGGQPARGASEPLL